MPTSTTGRARNPVTNRNSFAALAQLASEVRSTPMGGAKQFFSPLAPGYNKVLGGGTGCVPRNERCPCGTTRNSTPSRRATADQLERDRRRDLLVPLVRYGTQSLNTVAST